MWKQGFDRYRFDKIMAQLLSSALFAIAFLKRCDLLCLLIAKTGITFKLAIVFTTSTTTKVQLLVAVIRLENVIIVVAHNFYFKVFKRLDRW